jgi:hypothetical protein
VAVLVASIASGAHARPTASTTPAEDVRLLSEMIQTIHPDPFRSVTRAKFRAEVNAAAARAAGLEPNQRLVDLLRIIALLGPRNGHTGAFPLDPGHSRELHPYPLRLYDFSDGVFVVDEEGGLGLVGSKLVAVEGRPIAEVLARVRPLVPRDNSSHLRGLGPHYLLVSEILDGLGLVEGTGPAEMTFERPGGERVERTLTPIAASAYRIAFADPLHGHYPSVLPTAKKPLYLASGGKLLWTRTLAGGRAVYVGYNSVVAPSPAVVAKIRRLARGSKVRRVIVDVRRNGGGDNTTYGPLTSLFGSKTVNRRGRLYVLIGRATFSAAGNFSAEIDRYTRAIFVGEPTGGGVETYGDTAEVILPTAGLNVHVAAEYHSRARGPKDRRLAVAPDVRLEPSSKDYLAKRDPVLDRALRGL